MSFVTDLSWEKTDPTTEEAAMGYPGDGYCMFLVRWRAGGRKAAMRMRATEAFFDDVSKETFDKALLRRIEPAPTRHIKPYEEE